MLVLYNYYHIIMSTRKRPPRLGSIWGKLNIVIGIVSVMLIATYSLSFLNSFSGYVNSAKHWLLQKWYSLPSLIYLVVVDMYSIELCHTWLFFYNDGLSYQIGPHYTYNNGMPTGRSLHEVYKSCHRFSQVKICYYLNHREYSVYPKNMYLES